MPACGSTSALAYARSVGRASIVADPGIRRQADRGPVADADPREMTCSHTSDCWGFSFLPRSNVT